MAQVYGVQINNIFAALDEDSDDEVVISAPKAKKTVTEANRRGGNQTSTLRSSPIKDFSDSPVARGGRGGRGGGRGGGAGGRGGAQRGGGGGNRFGGERTFEEDDEAAGRSRRGRSDFPKSDRGTSSRGGRNREFDRHISGQNRGRGMKKNGGGGHNWGNTEADFGGSIEFDDGKEKSGWDTTGGWDEELAANGADQKEEKPWGDDTEVQGTKGEEEGEEAKEATPVEPELIDYEAYLKQQAAKRANLPTLSDATLRQPNSAQQRKDLEREGYHQHVKEFSADSRKAQMNLAVRYSESDVSDEDSDDDGGVRTKKGMTYNLVDLARGNSGGGRGRGGRGRGAQRMGSRGFDRDGYRGTDHGVAFNLGDQHAFPALG